MKSYELLEWCNWSPACKGFGIGTLAGIFATIISRGIIVPIIMASSPQGNFLEMIVYLLPIIPIVIEFPTSCIFAGSLWPGAHPLAFFCSEVLLNALGYAIIGWCIGYVSAKIRTHRHN